MENKRMYKIGNYKNLVLNWFDAGGDKDFFDQEMIEIKNAMKDGIKYVCLQMFDDGELIRTFVEVDNNRIIN